MKYKEKFKFGEEIKVDKKSMFYCGITGENLMRDLLVVFRNKKTGKLNTFPFNKKEIINSYNKEECKPLILGDK